MPDLPLMPPQASSVSGEMDAIFLLLLALTIGFSVLVMALVLFFAIRYRAGSRANRSNPKHHDLRIELAWTIIPLILGLGVFFWNAKLYAQVFGKPPANAMEVFVIGKQWMWQAQHANGIRENNELHIPVGRPVKLTMISQDVIHGFYVPAFRIKRDVIPGRYNGVWFEAIKPGRYHLFCSQYCGKDHSMMEGWVTAMDPLDFQAWYEQGGEKSARRGKTMVEAGEELYKQLACGSCHGATSTRQGPSLIGIYRSQVKLDNKRTVLADEDYLRESILKPDAKVVYGYEPTMNSYQDQLSEEQVLQLIAYIKTLKAPQPALQPAAAAPSNAPKAR